MFDTSEKATDIVKEYERRASSRFNFESQWKEVAERVCPADKDHFTSRGMVMNEGAKKTELQFDSTASIALNRFGAILDSLLTPRNQTWHKLTSNNRMINKNRDVKLWFEEVNRLLFKYRYAPKANFASQNQQNYRSLGLYGTGSIFTDDLQGGQGLRYKNIHLSENYFGENHQGVVDNTIRHFQLTARQAFQKWGDKLPENMKNSLKTNPEAKYFFLHCVEPNVDQDAERRDYKGMPYYSCYVSMEGKVLLSEGGYTSFPYSISRYEQTSGELYGRSPAMDVLPAIKTLNEEKKTMLKVGHRNADPVLLAHDDGVADGFSWKPGALNPGGVTADGRPLIHALPAGNMTAGKDMMDQEITVIKDAFLVSMFQILTETPEMSATEVMERAREKGMLLAPTIGRQQDEYLGPLIERELDILSHQGLLPPMPELLKEAGGEYDLEYDSPMTRAQRAEEASGLMRTVESALTVVNVTQNPEPLDHFNWDMIIPEIANIQGVPERWMRDGEMVQQIRQGRAQQAQQQQMVQAAPAAAAMVKAGAVARKG